MAYKIKNSKKKEEIISYRNSPFQEADYKEMAEKKGLTGKDKEVYVKFMLKRFPNEMFSDYAEEWVDRFKTGSPKSYMDSHSEEAYSEAVKEVDEVGI